MSDTAASLRRKISSAGDLESVVRTMKALAASSIGQYEHAVRSLADYYRTVELGLSMFQENRAGQRGRQNAKARTDEASDRRDRVRFRSGTGGAVQ